MENPKAPANRNVAGDDRLRVRAVRKAGEGMSNPELQLPPPRPIKHDDGEDCMEFTCAECGGGVCDCDAATCEHCWPDPKRYCHECGQEDQDGNGWFCVNHLLSPELDKDVKAMKREIAAMRPVVEAVMQMYDANGFKPQYMNDLLDAVAAYREATNG